MYNWLSHKAKNTKENLGGIKSNKVFQSPYSLSLAPKENWFGYIKSVLLKQNSKAISKHSNFEIEQALNE